MKDSSQPATRRPCNAALRAEDLRSGGENRSTQAAARTLNISVKLLDKWQKQALTPLAAAQGATLEPVTVAELRHLWALAR